MKKKYLTFVIFLISNLLHFKAQDSLIATLTGHLAGINSIDVSPDNKWLISVSKDESLRLWNLQNNSNAKTLSNFGYSLKRVKFNSKGDRFLVASFCSFSEFDFTKFKRIRLKKKAHTTFIENCIYSPKNDFIATSSWRDKTLIIWKASSLKKQSETNEVIWVDNAIFNKTSETLISGGHDAMIKIWDVPTGGLIKQLAGHNDWVYDICLSLDEKYIYSASLDKTIKIWNIASGKQIATLAGHVDGIVSIDLSKDGNFLASAGMDKEIIIWDINSQTAIKKFKAHELPITDVKFGNNSDTLYSCSMDKTIKIWRLNLPSK